MDQRLQPICGLFEPLCWLCPPCSRIDGVDACNTYFTIIEAVFVGRDCLALGQKCIALLMCRIDLVPTIRWCCPCCIDSIDHSQYILFLLRTTFSGGFASLYHVARKFGKAAPYILCILKGFGYTKPNGDRLALIDNSGHKYAVSKKRRIDWGAISDV